MPSEANAQASLLPTLLLTALGPPACCLLPQIRPLQSRSAANSSEWLTCVVATFGLHLLLPTVQRPRQWHTLFLYRGRHLGLVRIRELCRDPHLGSLWPGYSLSHLVLSTGLVPLLYTSLYLFPRPAITNHHKATGLTQEFILSALWRPDAQKSKHWQIKPRRLCSIHLSKLLATTGPCSLACRCFLVTSLSKHEPSPGLFLMIKKEAGQLAA